MSGDPQQAAVQAQKGGAHVRHIGTKSKSERRSQTKKGKRGHGKGYGKRVG